MSEPKHCDYCCYLKLNIKTIKRPKAFVKKFSKYINVCDSCIEANNLGEIPEYYPSELQQLVDRMENDPIVPVTLTTNEKEYLLFQNGSGILLDENKMRIIVKELTKTLELYDLNKFIQEENSSTYMDHHFEIDPDPEEKGKYLFPLDELNIKRKRFDPSKVWGCTCGNCSKKMSSKNGGEYFSFAPSIQRGFHYSTGIYERACSEGCANVIAKDIASECIHSSKRYQNYFDLEKLDQRLANYIKEL